MATMAESGTGQLDLGLVIKELFAVLGRNIVTFLVLTVILVGIPSLLSGYMQMSLLGHGRLFDWRATAVGLLAGLGSLILQGTIIYGTVTDLNGKPASLSDCLSIGLRSFLPVLAIGILLGIAVGCGMVLLIVPGLMLLVAWAVTIPAYVVEQTGIFAAFGRSAELTRGNRWRIFGLFVLYFVVLIIVEAVFGLFGTASKLAAGGSISLVTAMVVTPLISIANGVIGAVGAAVLYVELRRVRDGVGPQGLAAVFD